MSLAARAIAFDGLGFGARQIALDGLRPEPVVTQPAGEGAGARTRILPGRRKRTRLWPEIEPALPNLPPPEPPPLPGVGQPLAPPLPDTRRRPAARRRREELLLVALAGFRR